MRRAYPGSAYSERLSAAPHEAVPYINKTDKCALAPAQRKRHRALHLQLDQFLSCGMAA